MTESAAIQVSVIVPACKRPQLLAQAVQSVLAQSFRDLELVVVDDDPLGSAKAVVAGVNDPRIMYLAHRTNRGAAAARNTGLAHARGRVIAFLDDDDTLHPQFLEKMMPVIAGLAPDVGVLQCAVELVRPGGECTVVRPLASSRGDVKQAVLRGNKPGGIIGLVRREVFDVCGGFDESLPSAQDWDLWIRVSRKFRFEHVDDVLAAVSVDGDRISADPLRAIAAREHILGKYAHEFAQDPVARRIHEKRLGKLNSLVGRWAEAWRWFALAAAGRPSEWFRMLAWLLLERPFIPAAMASKRASRFCLGAVIAAGVLTAYSQFHALVSPYVINDDVCQHVWWMRAWRDPALFQADLLRQYAESLQNIGILLLYQGVSHVMDPVAFTKLLPFILFPLAVWALFRLVFTWTRDAYTALLSCSVFMVTPIYMQHMAGGHAHAFGYTLLLLFLSFFAMEKYRSAALVMLASTFFFPVVFALSAGFWLVALLFEKRRRIWWGAQKTVLAGALLGLVVLAIKFLVLRDPLIGVPFVKSLVSRMPELTSAGRWDVWPIPSVGQACVMFAQKGIFVFKAGYKTFLSTGVREFLLGRHVLLGVLVTGAGTWWWRHRKEISFFPLGALAVVSVGAYLAAAAVLLKLYAPDRYVSYSITLVALVFLTVPAGRVLSSWSQPRMRRYLQAGVLLLVFLWTPLIRDAGLKDYGANKKLYAFLATLPKDSLIAAFPDTADGIPVFSRRRVFVNEELSVALYDRYWETIKARTFDFFAAYYADRPEIITSFMERNGITHLVIERRRYSKAFLGGNVYFEPFGSWVRTYAGGRQNFYALTWRGRDCAYFDDDVCVFQAP